MIPLITGMHASGTQEYTVIVEMQQYPTLDELVGQYADGVMTITDVFISDVLREQMMAAQDEAADILLEEVPELDSALVKKSQTYLAGQYQADASSWGAHALRSDPQGAHRGRPPSR